jgi:putative tricarboxylic transport membrane protein
MALELVPEALGVLLTLENMAFIAVGVMFGMIAGSIPGFTGTNTVAIALPFTLPMSPEIALVFLSAIYVGASYGGAIPAVLINTPGTAGATATVLDAYPMSQKGEASKALGISILASCIAGIISAFIILLLLGPIGDFSFLFTNREIFVLGLFGLAAVAVAIGDNMIKGLVSGFAGLLIAAMPVDPTTGQRRLDFDFFGLYDEVPFVPVVVGLFAISELFYLINKRAISEDTKVNTSYGDILEGFRYAISKPVDLIRSMLIGLGIGSMPGAGTSVANFVSWGIAKNFSKKPEEFGKGNPEGVIASEGSNSAVTAGSLVPTLALGIPGSGTTAVMLAALLLHGVRPGPELMQEFALEANIVILSLFFANIALLVFAFSVSKYLVRIVSMPANIIVPAILALTVIGSFAMRGLMFDIWLMFIFGIIGFVMRKNNYSLIPMILGVILGPIIEGAFLRSMLVSSQDPMYFFGSTLAISLWIGIVLVLFGKPVYNILKGSIRSRTNFFD